MFSEIEKTCRSYHVNEVNILITDEIIEKFLLNSGFIKSKYGNYIYYNYIHEDVHINPYLTFSDIDFF